jgi:hypothetical protein
MLERPKKYSGAKPMLDTGHVMNRLTIAISVKKRLPFIVLLLAASLIMASVVGGTSKVANARTPNPEQTSSGKAKNMKIKIKIGGKALTATLADNETARDFASVLPLNVTMKDLFGREKYGDLPKALSENGPRKNKYEVGQIAYWSPAKQFAVYYHQDGESIPSPGIIPIATIDAGTEAFNVRGSVKVTIEAAK